METPRAPRSFAPAKFIYFSRVESAGRRQAALSRSHPSGSGPQGLCRRQGRRATTVQVFSRLPVALALRSDRGIRRFAPGYDCVTIPAVWDGPGSSRPRFSGGCQNYPLCGRSLPNSLGQLWGESSGFADVDGSLGRFWPQANRMAIRLPQCLWSLDISTGRVSGEMGWVGKVGQSGQQSIAIVGQRAIILTTALHEGGRVFR